MPAKSETCQKVFQRRAAHCFLHTLPKCWRLSEITYRTWIMPGREWMHQTPFHSKPINKEAGRQRATVSQGCRYGTLFCGRVYFCVMDHHTLICCMVKCYNFTSQPVAIKTMVSPVISRVSCLIGKTDTYRGAPTMSFWWSKFPR